MARTNLPVAAAALQAVRQVLHTQATVHLHQADTRTAIHKLPLKAAVIMLKVPLLPQQLHTMKAGQADIQQIVHRSDHIHHLKAMPLHRKVKVTRVLQKAKTLIAAVQHMLKIQVQDLVCKMYSDQAVRSAEAVAAIQMPQLQRLIICL